MEKDRKTAENQPVSEINFQIMKFRLYHSLQGGARPHFFRSVFPRPVRRHLFYRLNHGGSAVGYLSLCFHSLRLA